MLMTVVLGCATGAGVGQVTICGAVCTIGAVSMYSVTVAGWIAIVSTGPMYG